METVAKNDRSPGLRFRRVVWIQRLPQQLEIRCAYLDPKGALFRSTYRPRCHAKLLHSLKESALTVGDRLPTNCASAPSGLNNKPVSCQYITNNILHDI